MSLSKAFPKSEISVKYELTEMMAGSISLGPDISPAGRVDISPVNYNYYFCNSPVKYRCTSLTMASRGLFCRVFFVTE